MVNLPIEFSDKQVTPFGGMSLMKRFIDQTSIREVLSGYRPSKCVCKKSFQQINKQKNA